VAVFAIGVLHPWVQLICRRLPQLVPDAMDRTNASEDAEDYGLTPAEYVARGIGLRRWRGLANANPPLRPRLARSRR
jgi:hypothetical protein